tara:strand:+ start:228 stop:449 length:222 start_codon:yes stop_codon:yes gene_type:complete
MTKQNTKNKKPKAEKLEFTLDGYYIDKGNSYGLYKDQHGNSKMRKLSEDPTSHLNKNDPLVKQLIKERFKKNG